MLCSGMARASTHTKLVLTDEEKKHLDQLRQSKTASFRDVQRAQVRQGRAESAHFEKRYVRKDGSVVWVDLTVALARDRAGAPLYEISVIEDITQRKDAESFLRESEARFRSLTELSSDWYWEQDSEFKFTKVETQHPNPLLNLMLGKSRWDGPGVQR